MKTLTDNQRNELGRIRASISTVRKSCVEHNPGYTASPWVSVELLARTYHVHRGHLAALVRKGYLLSRPSDGHGLLVVLPEDTAPVTVA